MLDGETENAVLQAADESSGVISIKWRDKIEFNKLTSHSNSQQKASVMLLAFKLIWWRFYIEQTE